jgi:hypothetical protein
MKKSTLQIGLISCFLIIAGVIMKLMHWPGANLVMSAGAISFIAGYALLSYIDRSKFTKDGYEKFVNIFIMISMIVVVLTFLLKANHWPGAGSGMYVSHIILMLLVPFLYIQGTRETDPFRKLHYSSSAIIVALIAAISLFIWWRTSNPEVTI